MASESPKGKTPTPAEPKPCSSSFSTFALKQSELKAAHSGKRDKATQWQMKATEFYDRVLEQVERLLQNIKDEETAKQLSGALRSLHITQSRSKLSPEQFWDKAEAMLTLLQRIELHQPPTVHPPPTKQKPSNKVPQANSTVGRYSPERLNKINFKSTILAARFDIPSTKLASTQLGTGRAIPLCLPNDVEWDCKRKKCKRLKDKVRTTLVLNPTAVEILKSISGPVCVVSIVGPCRSGKSYVLSRLISSVGEECHFDLGHEMDPKTMGIWMWDRPFKIKLKDCDEEVTLILLDTEGIDAANASDQGDSQIFTLSVLLSSLLIYNSMTVPRREDLNQMHFVANLSRSIQVQTGEFAHGQGGMKLTQSNPRFMWLLRDVILIPTDRHNKPCHIKDHLLQKVLVEDATDDQAQNDIRCCLLGFFSSFDAETLPPPSTDPYVMQNIDNPLFQKHISPLFLQKLAYVKKRIFDNCSPKKGYTGGTVISGFQLSHMVGLYVEALNSPGGIPVIGSTWLRVLEATYTDGVDRAVKCYKKTMKEVIPKLPMKSEQLFDYHRQGRDKSLQVFKEATKLDSESESNLYQTYLDKLMSQVAAYDAKGDCVGGEFALYLERNYTESKALCQSELRKLKELHLDPLIKNLSPATDFKTIEAAFTRIISGYDSICVGPASEEVWSNFIEEQEAQRIQLESQLSAVKNYDEEAKKRMREMKEQQQMFNQKELELKLKMEQAKKDHEAKLEVMSEKYTKDAENLQQQNAKQLEEQEKRLNNMAQANLQKLKSENAQQLSNLRADFTRREQQLRDNSARTQQQIWAQQNEIAQLRQQINNRPQRSGGGCFIVGTKVTLTSGDKINIEKQAMGVKVLAMGDEVTTITEEYVEHTLPAGEKVFSFNDDEPFAALHHPFWTTEGWKCLDPELAKEENPSIDFKLLQVGDIIFRVAQTDPLLYEPVKVHRFNFITLSEPTKIYGLHLDGPRSYHANGYIVAANYPVLTKKRVRDGIQKLTEEQKESLQSAITSVQRELTTVLGSWAEDAFIDMGLTPEQ